MPQAWLQTCFADCAPKVSESSRRVRLNSDTTSDVELTKIHGNIKVNQECKEQWRKLPHSQLEDKRKSEKLPKEKWSCCDGCSRIYGALQTSVSVGADSIPTRLAELIIRKHKERGLCMYGFMNDIQWRILSGKSRYPEHLPSLSRAAAIFRECFWSHCRNIWPWPDSCYGLWEKYIWPRIRGNVLHLF